MSNAEKISLLEHEEEKDDDDDDDDGDTTNPFQPDVHSTPGPSNEDIPMTTMNREKEKGSGITETSFIEGSTHSRVLELDKKAWESLTGIFPNAKATELEATYSKTGKLQVKKFGFGKRAYPLFTVGRGGGGEQRLNPILPKQIKSALGSEREILIVQKEKEIEELQKSIQKMKKSQIMKMNNPQRGKEQEKK